MTNKFIFEEFKTSHGLESLDQDMKSQIRRATDQAYTKFKSNSGMPHSANRDLALRTY